VYNKKRLHSSLDYLPPEEYEELLVEEASQEEEIAKNLSV